MLILNEQVTMSRGGGGVLHISIRHCVAALPLHIVNPVSAALLYIQKGQTGCDGFFYILMKKTDDYRK